MNASMQGKSLVLTSLVIAVSGAWMAGSIGLSSCTPVPSATMTAPRVVPSASVSSVDAASSAPVNTSWTGVGPAAAGASKAEHDRALIALMGGDMATDGLPEVATSDGRAFDSTSYAKMTTSTHRAPAPSIRMLATEVKGKLPPEVIQRIIRQNFGRFRMCYEMGLRKDAALSGNIAVGFTISTKGEPQQIKSTSATTLKDTDVVSCVVKAFNALAFPAPESGTVQVVFPIVFAPPSSE